MTRLVPARILPPPSAKAMRAVSGESGALPVTLVVQEFDHTARAFPFRAARHAPDASSLCVAQPDAVLIEGGSRNHDIEAAPWTRHAGGTSSRFLAGAIAQEWPGIRLHNPQHQSAARVYRQADSLGLRAAWPGRRDTMI